MTIEMIFEIIVGVSSVIGLLWIGIFIGREFGTFEKFAVWLVKSILNDNEQLPPYEDN